MGIAHAENGRPIIVNGEKGLPGPDENGDYPLVVYPDWYESPDVAVALQRETASGEDEEVAEVSRPIEQLPIDELRKLGHEPVEQQRAA